MEYDIRIDGDPSAAELAFLEGQLNAYNIARVASDDYRPLAAFVRTGAIVAGVSGYTWAGMCEIHILWVAEKLRGQGLGARLLAAVEQEARTRGCSTIALSSYSFQAPDFYRHHGYQVAGAIPDCPPGFTHVYLYKHLEPNSRS